MFIFNRNIIFEQEITDILFEDRDGLRSEYLLPGSTLDAFLNHAEYAYMTYSEKKEHYVLDDNRVLRLKRIFIILNNSQFFDYLLTHESNAFSYILNHNLDKVLNLKPDEFYTINTEFYINLVENNIVSKDDKNWAPIVVINHFSAL